MVALGSAGVFFCAYRRRYTPTYRVLLVLSVIFSLYLPVAQFVKYYSLHVYIDFAVWLELLKTISTMGHPASSIQGFLLGQFATYPWFAVHFTPLLYVLAVPYRIAPYAETLMALNFIIMLSSIVPLYKLAAHIQEDKRFARFVVVLFLWYTTFHYITLYGFEMLRLSIPVLLWMLYFWESRKIVPYFLFVMFAVLIREDVGLTVGMFGISLLLCKESRMKGLATCALGFGGSLIISRIVMPLFSPTPESNFIFSRLLDHYGSAPLEIVKNIVLQNGSPGSGWLNPIKWVNVVMLFLPFLFIPLFSPRVLVGTLASVGVGMISYAVTHSSYMLYYISPAIPFIFYAFIKGWPRCMEALGQLMARLGWERSFPVHTAATAAVFVGAFITNVWFGPSPVSLQFWSRTLRPAPFHTQDFHWSSYRITDHHRNAEAFVEMIPDDAIVSAQEFAHSRLFKKRGIMLFPRLVSDDGRVQAEYVLLDVTHNGLSPKSPIVYLVTEDAMEEVMDSPDEWELIRSDGQYFLYKKMTYPS